MVTIAVESVADLVGAVRDPEIPALSIADLGIVRSVEVDGSRVIVTITPTYSGCPAMDVIRADISTALEGAGYQAEIHTVFAPAWTTDDISPDGRQRLLEHGIAPPGSWETVLCPRCRSDRPNVVSEFGSTACKALLVCSACGEPFHFFKELR